MAINKLHEEFHALDMGVGWETPPGYPTGIAQKILSGALDETAKRKRSLIVRAHGGERSASDRQTGRR